MIETRRFPPLALLVLTAALSMDAARADDSGTSEATAPRQFTFSWPFAADDAMRPRGGSSRGAPVTLADAPTADWLALAAPGLGDFERDRRAILAMAGPYRTSFDFLETVQYVPGAEPQPPYQSWSTEYVYVAADEGEYISLQHIIVMFVVTADGTVAGPMVQKHWRQDWRYQDTELTAYIGHDRWERQRIPAAEAQGRWTQAVFQVDDAPRYESIGRWEHTGSYSSWTGEPTWRPLPRREFSIRDDYDVLLAVNQHTIVPNGWVHEENNLKLDLDADGRPAADRPYLARELGVNRYERIEGFDFAAGDAYWAETGEFWADVRAAWQAVIDEHQRFALAGQVDGRALFEPLFDYAAGIDAAAGAYDRDAGRRFIDATLAAYVEPLD